MSRNQILFNDHFQNFKKYNLHKAQLIIADVPYNLGNNAYASNPAWYQDGDNENGESELAKKTFFHSDGYFKPAEFMHFCGQLLKKEPKEKGQAPAMLLFCAFDQQMYFIELAKKYGLPRYINLVFRKNFSAQVLKANMRIVGNCEYGLVFYRDKLPKFNNKGKMIFNCIDWERDDTNTEKLHPNQKPIKLLKKLIEIFTDEGDIVIDPTAGSGSTLIAALELNRKAYGFEIDRKFFKDATKWVDDITHRKKDIKIYGFPKTEMDKERRNLFTDWHLDDSSNGVERSVASKA